MAPNNRLPALDALTQDDEGWGYYLCTYKEVRAGRSGGEFLFLSLQDASAQIVAKLLADADPGSPLAEPVRAV